MTGVIAALAGNAANTTSINVPSEAVFIITSSPATVSYSLQSDGQIVATNVLDIRYWITPQSGMSDYEVLATLNYGGVDSGVIGSWQALNASRTWELTSLGGFVSSQMVLQIRRIGTTTILDSATITLQAEAV
jgi:hypothetical protein